MDVSREAFYDYLNRKADPWKYESLATKMMKIHVEDEYNDCYGRKRMYMALMQKKEAGEIRTCLHKMCVRIYEHNFGEDKESYCRHMHIWQGSLTQYSSKFAENTRANLVKTGSQY